MYTVRIIADTLQVAWSTVEAFPNRVGIRAQEVRYDVPKIPIDKDSCVVYLFTYHSAAGSTVGLVKIVTPTSLIQDIAAMRKLSWITEQATQDKYVGLINTYAGQMEQNNYAGAKTTLTNILSNISADSSHTLTADACNSLRPDIQQLLTQLPSSFAMTVSVVGPGTVAKSPDQTLYDSASTVQLTGTPNSGYSFTGWSGDVVSTVNPLSIMMDGNKNVTATFQVACQSPSTIASNFNGTAIPGGDFIWFNGVVKIANRGTAPAEVYITGGTVAFANSTVTVPDNVITFSSTAISATTIFNTAFNRWETTVPATYTDNVFLSGALFTAPSGGLLGGINPVTWIANFSSNTAGLSAQWKWAAVCLHTIRI